MKLCRRQPRYSVINSHFNDLVKRHRNFVKPVFVKKKLFARTKPRSISSTFQTELKQINIPADVPIVFFTNTLRNVNQFAALLRFVMLMTLWKLKDLTIKQVCVNFSFLLPYTLSDRYMRSVGGGTYKCSVNAQSFNIKWTSTFPFVMNILVHKTQRFNWKF